MLICNILIQLILIKLQFLQLKLFEIVSLLIYDKYYFQYITLKNKIFDY